MFYLFIKNSYTQAVIDKLNDKWQYWTRPSSSDRKTLLIAIYSKNTHGTRASIVVAKAELLAIRTKDFQYNIQDVNKVFLLKEKETFSSKRNLDILFQLFQIYESCLV